MNAIRTNTYLDDEAYAIARELPRKVSTSKILRWLLKASSDMTEKEWKVLLQKDKDLREAHEWIAPRLRRLIGKDK